MFAWYYGTIVRVDREPREEYGPLRESEWVPITDPAELVDKMTERLAALQGEAARVNGWRERHGLPPVVNRERDAEIATLLSHIRKLNGEEEARFVP